MLFSVTGWWAKHRQFLTQAAPRQLFYLASAGNWIHRFLLWVCGIGHAVGIERGIRCKLVWSASRLWSQRKTHRDMICISGWPTPVLDLVFTSANRKIIRWGQQILDEVTAPTDPGNSPWWPLYPLTNNMATPIAWWISLQRLAVASVARGTHPRNDLFNASSKDKEAKKKNWFFSLESTTEMGRSFSILEP